MDGSNGKADSLPPCEISPREIALDTREEVFTLFLDARADPELTTQGWQRRFTADAVRAEEATRLYIELGFEVRSQSVKPSEFSLACAECGLAACHTFVTIYTRRKQPRK